MTKNGSTYRERWIAICNDQHNRVIQGTPFTRNGHLCDVTSFMLWNINHIIRYISLSQQSSN